MLVVRGCSRRWGSRRWLRRSGFSLTLGRLDGGASLDELLEHVRAVDRATSLPVSVDLENGHGPEPESVARVIERAASAGAVGGSIEDWDPATGIYPLERAVERVTAAAQAARQLSFPFLIIARAENHITRQSRSRRHDHATEGLRGRRG